MSEDITNMSFKDAYKKLTDISTALEKNNDDLDLMLANVKDAAILIEHCRQKLSSTQAEITKIITQVDTPETGTK